MLRGNYSFSCASDRIPIISSNLQAQGKDPASFVDAETVSQREDPSSRMKEMVNSENWDRLP